MEISGFFDDSSGGGSGAGRGAGCESDACAASSGVGSAIFFCSWGAKQVSPQRVYCYFLN